MQNYVIKTSAVRLVTGDCFGAPNLSVSAAFVDSR